MRNTSTLLQRAAAQAGINTSTLASFLSDPLLTSSLIANAYDSVWALTIAYHNIFKENLKLEVNNVIADMKNLSFRGTAVSSNHFVCDDSSIDASIGFVFLERP